MVDIMKKVVYNNCDKYLSGNKLILVTKNLSNICNYL